VDVGEDKAFSVGVPVPQRRQLVPAIADIAAERVEAPQQGRGVGQAVAERALSRADRAVVERERRVILPKLDVEQRLVPPDMGLIGMARGSTTKRLARRHPSQAVFRPPGHFHDMRDRVMRPKTQRFEFGGCTRFVFGAA
jgi:predicted GNAT family acetyltransferase